MRSTLGWWLVFALGCQGAISEPEAAPADPRVVVDPETECADAVPAVGDTPLRRLTREQYDNTVRDVFGLVQLPAGARIDIAQLTDGRAGEYTSTQTAATEVELRLYLSAAAAIAEAVGPDAVAAYAGCDPSTDPCVRTLVASLGRRVFRRPPIADELDRYTAFFADVDAADGRDAALTALAEAMLGSPAFLYREEPADTDGLLADHAIASRLSYLLWQSAPDEALLAAADAGLLSDPAERESQVRRMIDDPRFSRGVRSFHVQWLGIADLPELELPGDFTQELGESMVNETATFTDHVVRRGDGRLATLLTADFSFVDGRLAELYEVEAPAEDFGRVTLPSERTGLLTHASVLARFGEEPGEVRRGKFVRDQLLCSPPPEIPDNIVPDFTVDRLETSPCMNCHRSMDLIGYGFSRFDALGRFDAGLTPERTPEIVATGPELEEVAGTFEDTVELGGRLADSPVVEACVARPWFRSAAGRIEQARDVCNVYALEQLFVESDGDIRGLMVAIATADWFVKGGSR